MITRAIGLIIDAASAALKADAGILAAFDSKPVQVLQVVPETGPNRVQSYPYVNFGAAEKRHLPESCGAARARVTIYLQVWADDKNIRRVSNIAEACEAPLLKLALDAGTGLRITQRQHALTRSNFDQDRQLLYGLCQVEFDVSAITA